MAAAASSSTSLSLSLSLDTIFSSSHRLSSSSSSSSSTSLPFSSSSHLPKPHHHHLSSLKPPQTTPTPTTFLDPTTLHRLHTLQNFTSAHQFPHGGSLQIRPMEAHEVGPSVSLLAESFGESMWMHTSYVKLLEFLVAQYVVERRSLMPHAVMLVGFYHEERSDGDGGGGGPQLACTVEVSFDARGANAAPPTPLPPPNCPYICNMTVKKAFRRRGIGRELLKACEELISQMKTMRKVYLHCRVIDTVPFQMYKKAAYKVVKTDSILIWFTLQRRKYLMCKELPPFQNSQLNTSNSEDSNKTDEFQEASDSDKNVEFPEASV